MRVAVACANFFLLGGRYANPDGFHDGAVAFAAGEAAPSFRIGWVYAQALGLVYRLTGPHALVGYLASTVAWLGAALALDATLRLLSATHASRVAALVLFAFLPSSIFFSTVILRDAYELLFTQVMMLCALRIVTKGDWGAIVPMALAGTGANVLHLAFAPWGVLVMGATVIYGFATRRPRLGTAALALLVTVAFVAITVWLFAQYGYNVVNGVEAASESYRQAIVTHMQPRTELGLPGMLPAEAPSILRMLVGFVSYMIEPLPWSIANAGDLGVFAENVIRLGLIGLAVLSVLRADRALRFPLLLTLGAYFALEGIWSLGTAAWGTAIRHHFTALGLLLACASPALGRWRRAQPA